MEFQLSVSASPDSHPFDLWVEPEGMMYQFPARSTVILSFRGPDAMKAEISHRSDGLIVWRPADTEVWATTADGSCDQIAGWRDLPAPGLDSGGAPMTVTPRQLIEDLFHPEPPDAHSDGSR
ncbi:hypothetical protein [Catellatospora methionotrophica]|uniref:hypothetical protein n=1 Tax=Catellatospora methionotrophica TaxID=121620 RepID=UPI0033DEFA91